MKTVKDYGQSPAKAFDAVEDIREYLGEVRWTAVSPQMAQVRDPKQFAFYCMLAGIEGYPVEAWYELYHGGGSWTKALEAATPTADELASLHSSEGLDQ